MCPKSMNPSIIEVCVALDGLVLKKWLLSYLIFATRKVYQVLYRDLSVVCQRFDRIKYLACIYFGLMILLIF